MSRAETASVTSRMRSASVDLPWSMCAMIEKLRMLLWSTNQTGYGLDLPVPAHETVRPTFLLDVADAPEARLLECAP